MDKQKLLTALRGLQRLNCEIEYCGYCDSCRSETAVMVNDSTGDYVNYYDLMDLVNKLDA
jgi:hypothetical protein